MKPERRSYIRFQRKLPMTVRTAKEELHVFTTNVSAKGVAFEVESTFNESILGFDITLPPEVTSSASLAVRCEATVVRIQVASHCRTEVAASIYRYEFLKMPRD
jgi:hypothetical protein